jgi:hypothetical protein
MTDERPRLDPGFSTWKEWGERINANSLPPDPDDTPVLAGQTGPRRRATREELIAFVERERVRIAREHPDW